ncbi:Uncharacterized protein TCM_040285 [Theobroma cacao]|uniref:Uncharacterized protein n=1 Tax=Theobroma cacao TaxID=3641 RepID=A0A061GT95_THECC|nr:Uncharacterized protein TCM_040285 [Theobroma cacao]
MREMRKEKIRKGLKNYDFENKEKGFSGNNKRRKLDCGNETVFENEAIRSEAVATLIVSNNLRLEYMDDVEELLWVYTEINVGKRQS